MKIRDETEGATMALLSEKRKVVGGRTVDGITLFGRMSPKIINSIVFFIRETSRAKILVVGSDQDIDTTVEICSKILAIRPDEFQCVTLVCDLESQNIVTIADKIERMKWPRTVIVAGSEVSELAAHLKCEIESRSKINFYEIHILPFNSVSK